MGSTCSKILTNTIPVNNTTEKNKTKLVVNNTTEKNKTKLVVNNTTKENEFEAYIPPHSKIISKKMIQPSARYDIANICVYNDFSNEFEHAVFNEHVEEYLYKCITMKD